MGYSTKEIIEKMKKEENVDISLRTLNYYTHDLKMFPDLFKGKCGYTDREFELLKRITFLKNNSSLTLSEIKDIVNDDEKYLDWFKDVVFNRKCEFSRIAPENDTCSYSCTNSSSVDASISNLSNSSSSACLNSLTSSTVDSSLTTYNGVGSTGNAFLENNGFESTGNAFLKIQAPSTSFSSPPPQKVNHDVTVKVNKDVTITVSSDVSRDKLIEIVNFINSLN